MPVPAPTRTHRRTPRTFTLDPTVLAQLKALSVATGTPQTRLLDDAATQHVATVLAAATPEQRAAYLAQLAQTP